MGFTHSSMAVEEDAGSVILELSITNPDPDLNTQCEVNLTGGTGTTADLAGFEATLLTFPAGSYEQQTVEIFITDDDLSEEQEIFIFTIANVSGGDSATVDGNDSFILTISPNDQVSAVNGLIISEVMDGNRSGGQPKFIEITNTSSQPRDIGGFQIWRGSNGNDPSQAASIPAGTVLSGAGSWVIAYSTAGLLDAGFAAPDQTSAGINGNGNDVYQIRTETGEYIDAFGMVGTGTTWYENSFAERIPSVSSGGTSYDPGEWVISSLVTGTPSNGSPGTPGTHIFDPVVAVEMISPNNFLLMNVYPNPFNPVTTVLFMVVGETHCNVSLRVFDVNGRFVESLYDGVTEPGTYTVKWDGGNFSSGIYFIRLAAGADVQIQRVTLLR
ncbi:MAG: lamin tail domain-containing protein [Candidatus Marinimicrobia bacterium]|nr:lamin tail domain-containing protein [Candidatus Neomarinimicrobiota bacterium]